MTTIRPDHAAVAPAIESARPDATPNATSVPTFPPPSESGLRRDVALSHSNLTLPRSPLIGRDHEVAVIQQLLLQDHVGLLTLTGPGGIGKTRLAMQVAVNLLDHFVDGVYFVSLAPIRDPDLVDAAIAQTLGLREAAGQSLAETLQTYLKDRQLLLVLDNFEQVVAAAALVGDLLNICRRLKTLVTSRTTLHLYGEQEFPVPPLALPDLTQLAQSTSTATVTQYAAIELFCQRASAAKPDFALTASNVAEVAKICLRLDGLPLAIELAAARIKLFSPSALLTHLQQRLPLLTGGPHDQPERQRTLRNDIAWSYDLLTPAEQTLFRRLAVFVGGFSLAAAQAVGNADGDLSIDVLEGVATLVDQNLLKQVEQPGNEARFGMLETIREYGLEQLDASGEAEAIHHHHASFFRTLAATIALGVLPDRQGVGLTRLLIEQANLRLALAWSQRDDVGSEIMVQFTGILCEFWILTGFWREGRHWLEAALARTTATEWTVTRAGALANVGIMAVMQGDHTPALLWLEEAMPIAQELGAHLAHADVLTALGWMAHGQQNYDLAITRLRHSLAIRHTLGNKILIAGAQVHLADVLYDQHDYAGAQSLYEEALATFQEFEIEFEIADVIQRLGLVAQRQAEYPRAWALLRESLTRWRVLGTLQWKGIPAALEGLADICATRRHYMEAARLFGAAEVLFDALGVTGLYTRTPAADKHAALSGQLESAAFVAAWAEGRKLTAEQAVDYALALPDIASSAPVPVLSPPPAYPAGLSAREVEVLRLLAHGLTYVQIADKLVVSRRTINAHVGSIYSKLAVNGRAAATRFAVDHHLI